MELVIETVKDFGLLFILFKFVKLDHVFKAYSQLIICELGVSIFVANIGCESKIECIQEFKPVIFISISLFLAFISIIYLIMFPPTATRSPRSQILQDPIQLYTSSCWNQGISRRNG